MQYEGGEWTAAMLVGTPRHHAIHVELVNLADFERGLPHDRPVTFVVELLEQEVREVTTGAESAHGGKAFRSTYSAKIISTCSPRPEQEPRHESSYARDRNSP
jgi:hypothetical protein